jgi:hypothetical protein
MQMTYLAAAVASLSLIVLSPAHADDLSSRSQLSAPNIADIGTVPPALERYTRDTLLDGLWHRPGLSPRDRSIVTLAALIACDQIALLPPYLKLALDSGVNASGRRRSMQPITAEPVTPLPPPARGIGPLLARMIDHHAASGLPPAYLPKDEGDDA